MARRKVESFGDYIRIRREDVGKSIRGLAAELEMTPAYLSDIEKGNRYAPEKYLARIADVLRIEGDDLDQFYELAGKSRNNTYPDLADYIGSTPIARAALRRARDRKISDSEWQKFIDSLSGSGEGPNE